MCYSSCMRSVEAKYEQGTLKLSQPLPLTPGERVRVTVVRQPDPKRWDLARFRAADTVEDLSLSEAGLVDWDRAIDSDAEGSD
jgi:predicted DNA-binding antitoxin AbrB/MazE fold protein